WKYDISTNEWTWVKGPNTVNDPGSYGTQGVTSPTNLPPSRTETSCSWTDNAGNLWLYGGFDLSGNDLGDLWKYDISTNEWVWVHGANSPNPPAVYGTLGVAAPANTPGGRHVYASWTDLSGNLWLFGGLSSSGSGGYFSDLWKYDISINQWTWIKGPNVINNPGNYGAKCVAANTNMPPARYENRARVRDTCGNFWNFGGGVVALGNLNDLWHYNVSANDWTWVSGDDIPNQAAIYGVQGVSAPANKPGGKSGSVAWLGNNGYIWVFGGFEIGGVTNNLFRYVPCPCTSSSLCSCISAISATVTTNNVPCNGQCTGTATVVATGGSQPYTYSWSAIPAQTSQTATGLCAGSYSVIVRDANSLTFTATVNITQPSAITASVSSTPT
ncbi:MAG: kelch repeat-containing protein, partial [Planctomycetota bacterium]